MRRLLVLCLLFCLAAPTAAWALSRSPGEGTLAVRNGVGRVRVDVVEGAILGKLVSGRMEVTVPADGLLTPEETCDELNVWGADNEPPARESAIGGGAVVICPFIESRSGGTPEVIRFRLIEKRLILKIGGHGIFISLVAERGGGFIQGEGGEDGTYSVNSRPFESLPDEGARFTFRPATLP